MVGTGEFGAFYSSAYGRTVASVLLLTGDLSTAEDAAQEAFARALSRWPRLQQGNPEGWVRAVAINQVRDRWRHRKVEERYFPVVAVPERSEGPSGDAVDMLRALDGLPATQREALVLHYYFQYSVSEIARHQRVAVGTV